jgi:hypothetical protein
VIEAVRARINDRAQRSGSAVAMDLLVEIDVSVDFQDDFSATNANFDTRLGRREVL